MEAHELSATAFAEKLSVGRATISHLMSGRNKPSLDFVMKVVSTFPEVTLNELVFGVKTSTTLGDVRVEKISKFNDQKSTSAKSEELRQSSFRDPDSHRDGSHNSQKPIDRIVIFFRDGTFTTHTPNESQ